MTRRISTVILTALLGGPWLGSPLAGDSPTRLEGTATPHRAPHWPVRLTPHSGPSRIATLEGVGCTHAICSRLAVRTRAAGGGQQGETLVNFNAIGAIRSRRPGQVTVDFVDGSSRQVVIPSENRVLYLFNDTHGSERLDMAEFSAIEFLR